MLRINASCPCFNAVLHLDKIKKYRILACFTTTFAVTLVVSIVPAAVIGTRFSFYLNHTSSITVCPSQSDVVLVLSNFTNPDYSMVTITQSSTSAPSTVISLVQSMQPFTMTYQGNVSLQQARNMQLYVLPGSLFIVIFTFFDNQTDKNLTVQFRKYNGAARPGQILFSQSVGPSAMSHSVSYTIAESGYVEVMIINNEGLIGNYVYIFLTKELHNLNSEFKCTVNSTIRSCTISALPSQNILLGLPTYDDETSQCHPIVDVSLTGPNTLFVLVATTSLTGAIICGMIIALLLILIAMKKLCHKNKYKQLNVH